MNVYIVELGEQWPHYSTITAVVVAVSEEQAKDFVMLEYPYRDRDKIRDVTQVDTNFDGIQYAKEHFRE